MLMDRIAPRSRDSNKGTDDKRVVHPLKFEGDDPALVRALRSDHPGAYKALYKRFAPEVHRVLIRVLGPASGARIVSTTAEGATLSLERGAIQVTIVRKEKSARYALRVGRCIRML